MQPTDYPHVNAVLTQLLADMQPILGAKLAGVYLYGSLVVGDFDDGTSDMDLLAAISDELDDRELAALDAMHQTFLGAHPAWDNRLEIAYLSLHALKTFRDQSSTIAIISPGEPFHTKTAGRDWLMNWYLVREKSVTLYGAPPEAIIDPISKDEFIGSVRAHMLAWRDWLDDIQTRPSQAYVILTMCRGLYTCTIGEHVSKRLAALWAAGELPEWSGLIHDALRWRLAWREKDVDDAATLPDMRRFVEFVWKRLLAESG